MLITSERKYQYQAKLPPLAEICWHWHHVVLKISSKQLFEACNVLTMFWLSYSAKQSSNMWLNWKWNLAMTARCANSHFNFECTMKVGGGTIISNASKGFFFINFSLGSALQHLFKYIQHSALTMHPLYSRNPFNQAGCFCVCTILLIVAPPFLRFR